MKRRLRTQQIYTADSDRSPWRRVWHIFTADPYQPETVVKQSRCGQKYFSIFDLISTKAPRGQICRVCISAIMKRKMFKERI